MKISKGKKWGLAIAAIVLIALTLINASWLAPMPKGKAQLMAHRGVYHQYDKRAATGRDTCTAQYIFPPKHEIFENTLPSIREAFASGAAMVEVDVAPTKDGKMVLFHDWTVDCRTNGKGETRDLTLAELKALDIGYGYTADKGKSYPLRGKGIGQIPTVEEALAAFPDQPLLFNFKSKDESEADQLLAILKASGRDYKRIGDAFYGGPNPVRRIRKLAPGNWTFNLKGEAKQCTMDYALYGWTGIVPESCRGSVLAVPINYQWAFWGWPNRTIARMESVGAKVIVFGPFEKGKSNEGISSVEELNRIPASFNGIIWTENVRTIGPALQKNRKEAR
ncbi:MAG: glycerophosphodiester phosphodiesterase [Sphingomonadales bacterium]|nr:glycerophosphodiester phosphodiesterase [Sphingomonadales bacterium]